MRPPPPFRKPQTGRAPSPASPRTPSTRTPSISPARAAAFVILRKVATSAAHSDDLLHAPAVNALSAEDRNLATTLVMGVLRWQMALDQRILPMLQRQDTDLHPAALLALRMGVFQLDHLTRVPAHAVIHEAVELARANGAAHATGLVNALLRRITREAQQAGQERKTLISISPAELAHPHWLLQRWRSRFGGKATRLIAAYDQQEAPAHGLFGDPATEASVSSISTTIELCDAGSKNSFNGIEASATSSEAALRRDGAEADGDTGAQAAAEEKTARPSRGEDRSIQDSMPLMDDGSRLVAELAAAAVVRPGRILDCCAAPGGKTLVLAHRHPAAAIVAADISARRLDAMRKRLERQPEGKRVETVVADMTKPEVLPGDFDLILCDAPCSGTGTLARNPEIRLRLQESDLPRQAERQHAILREALHLLAPGGRLLYSTCSLEPEENEGVVQPMVEEGLVRMLPLAPLLDLVPGLGEDVREPLRKSAITPEGALRTLPGVHPCDGFYAALLERI